MRIQESEVNDLVADALNMYRKTPRCFCRNIRLCCVTSPELTPRPFRPESTRADAGHWVEQTRVMCGQSARQSLMLSPQDLFSYLSPDPSSPASAAGLGIQFVVIDIRYVTEFSTFCVDFGVTISFPGYIYISKISAKVDCDIRRFVQIMEPSRSGLLPCLL